MSPAAERREADFLRLFPALAGPGSATLRASLHYRRFERGATLLREGSACAHVPFVLEGRVRVFKRAESGRELTLYRIEPGESCMLSSACAAGLASFPGTAVAETELEAAFLPASGLPGLLERDSGLRDFALGQYARKLAGLFELCEELAFRRVDERLAATLAERLRGAERDPGAAAPAELPNLVIATHQELADQLGSSREVVSRILKDWEDRGLLRLGRGRIELSPDFPERLGFEARPR